MMSMMLCIVMAAIQGITIKFGLHTPYLGTWALSSMTQRTLNTNSEECSQQDTAVQHGDPGFQKLLTHSCLGRSILASCEGRLFLARHSCGSVPAKQEKAADRDHMSWSLRFTR